MLYCVYIMIKFGAGSKAKNEEKEDRMLIDLTLAVAPQLRKNAQGQEMKAFTGHLGTHFDVMNKEFPLEYVHRKGVLFDVAGAEEIGSDLIDLSAVAEGDFILFRTGFMERFGYGTDEYSHRHPYLSWDLIDALIGKKAAMIGIDCAGIRRGKEHTPADQMCADHGTFVIENLCHLDRLSGYGTCFTVHTFPVNFPGMSGLPCRVVAEVGKGMFAGKTAVITGGGHGIGQMTARAFREEGCLVEVIDLCPGDHFVGDLSDKKVLEEFARQVLEKHERIDFLINNAPPAMKGIDECSYEEFQSALAVGVTAPFYLAKLFADHFAPGASIVNISSSRDRMSQPQTESYTAAKGGIAALTHALAVSFAGKVRVNSIFVRKKPDLLRVRISVLTAV